MNIESTRPNASWTRATVLAVAALLLAGSAGAEELAPRQVRGLVQEAKSALLEGNSTQARVLVQRALVQPRLSRSQEVEALLTACAATFNTGDHALAFAYCDRAEHVGGPSWRVDGLRGMAHLTLGETDQALDSFRAALRQNRESPTLRRGLRAALRAKQQPEVTGTVLARGEGRVRQ